MKHTLNIKLLEDRILVKPLTEEKSTSKILLPESAKEKPQKATVVAAGPGKKEEPMTLAQGDIVLYGKYAGTEVTVEGKEYLLLRQSDIYAIFTS